MSTADLMQQARAAMRAGQLPQARRLLRQVIHEDPQNHAAWLLLAQATPDPKVAAHYVQRAELLRPDSPLVQQAQQQLEQKQGRTSSGRGWRYAAFALVLVLLLGLLGFTFGRGAWEQVQAARAESEQDTAVIVLIPTLTLPPEPTALPPTPTLSAAVNAVALLPLTVGDAVRAEPTAVLTPGTSAAVEQVKTTATPDAEAQTVAALGALPPAIEHGISLEAMPIAAAEGPVVGVEAVAEEDPVESGEAAQEQSIKDAAFPLEENEVTEAEELPVETAVSSAERWIDVNLSTQTIVAYEGETPVFSTLISSGLWNFPTVTGDFHTYLKYESQDMNGYLLGYDYYLTDVPYVMYFYEDYAIHGAYWHNSFGTPMSHGCVNVSPLDAGWLFEWAPVGTLVSVHY
jgi:lipoprotein-anchoring transpeptidase ErfK/SrfK